MADMERIAGYALKQLEAGGASDVVVDASASKMHQVKFVNSRIVSTNDWNESGIALFASFNKRIVSANLHEHTEKNADAVIKRMADVARHVAPKEDYNGIAKGPFGYAKRGCDASIAQPGLRGVEMCEEAISAALDAGAKRSAGQLQLGYGRTLLLTSGGVEAESESAGAYFSVRAFADRDASGAGATCSVELSKLDAAGAAGKAAELAVRSQKPAQGKPGRYDVLFDALPFAALLNNVADAASVFSMEAGYSFFEGNLSQAVAGENITLLDDATLPDGLNSTPFDDEGAPTKRNAIIERGVLKTYLHNNSTAKKYGVADTANAGLVAPHAWNLVLEAGDSSAEEMIAQTKRGIWITNLWYTRFQNYRTGEFSTIPRDAAFLIENGELKGPVANIRIADSFPRMLQNVAGLGKDAQWIKSWEAEMPTLTPAALVKDTTITAPTK
jgi:PmbA protein